MKNTHRFSPPTLAIALSMALTATANAGDVTNFSALSQTEFLAVSKDLVAVTSTKSIEPAAPLGLTGFDVSASTSVTKIQDGAAWAKVSGDSTSNLMQTKVAISKGLSSGLDVGGFVSKVPNNNVSALGVHVKYALLEGNAITPAVAVRASYSRLGGVSGMTLSNTGVDVLVSKGLVGFTPYAGVGSVISSAQATGKSDESFTQSKSFVGVSWNVAILNLSAEVDRTGKHTSASIKAGVRF